MAFFETSINHIEVYINKYLHNSDYLEHDLQNYFNQYIRSYFTPSQFILTYNAPEVEFLMKFDVNNNDRLVGAFYYFTNQGLTQSSKDYFDGYMLAYEFHHRESSVLFSRRESDKKYIHEIKNKIEVLENDYQTSVIDFIAKADLLYEQVEIKEQIKIHNSREKLANWLEFNRIKINEIKSTAKNDIENLKNQYAELLKLEEPVKYWTDRASELNKKANIMMWILGAITLIAISLTYVLLWWTPEGMLESIFKGNITSAIRWSIVFTIFISFIIFLFRAIMKFMFSNYHLARDAEEREKLTYLYISLLSKGNFSEEERKIVFQALFSRSDTGLLKEDSSPTMPGIASILEKK